MKTPMHGRPCGLIRQYSLKKKQISKRIPMNMFLKSKINLEFKKKLQHQGNVCRSGSVMAQ
ncbi:MAG: hypothetical protein EAZ70_11200 [Runella slithyformis]|nr:MAG: hypothetical protein EAY79_11930 [Runella slithyformis]TAE95501.1 MAG: hypothetical protein EAZ80_09200 [Runella slithyformis]TAF24880.1 MAG: hypothetical protein EAZ70_11200 [Runella slithyformis]TAF48908.1 MAG: hypothetical protein EAZ63_02645 [Runella slithyformis]TAF79509.1 MAG: hypothetical protein EAZ50_11230 [Runella slithyformis]